MRAQRQVHAFLLMMINDGLDDRVARGVDEQRLNQKQLSDLSGVAQPNLSAMWRGKPASERTWQKLWNVAWPDGLTLDLQAAYSRSQHVEN